MGTKQYDNYADLIIFTRASSATYLDSDGILKTASNNIPRIDYDANGNRKGLLIEEARTNLVTYSDFSFSWILSGATLIDNSITSPDGTTSAASVTSISGASYGINNGGLTVTGANYTASAFFKANGFNYAKLTWLSTANATDFAVFNLSTGEISGGTYASASIEPFGNGWYRCSITSTLAATSSAGFYAWMSDGTLSRGAGVSGDGTSGVYIYGAQLESGSTPSSYIPTSGSTATRSADAITVPSANLPWPTPNVIGPELVTNGTFDTDSDWTKAGSWAIGSGVASCTGAGNNISPAEQIIQSGKTYKLTLDVIAGNLSGFYTGATPASTTTYWGGSYVASSAGSYEFYYTATTSGYLTIRGIDATMDNVSLREIDPLSVSIQMDGKMTYADLGIPASGTGSGSNVDFYVWKDDASNYVAWHLDTLTGSSTGRVVPLQEAAGVVDSVQAPSGSDYSPGVNVPFNIASRHGSTFINGAVDGVALTSDTTPVALPDLSSTDLNLAFDYMGTIRQLRMWNVDLGDTGIAEAST